MENRVNKFKRKVVLIGNGSVGSSYAFSLVNQGIAQELAIIDINEKKVEGDAMDLSHGSAYNKPINVYKGCYEDCADADIVVITAGIPQKPGQSRLDIISTNLKIIKEMVELIMKSGFNGIFLVASNPVDIITYAVKKYSGLPYKRVIGSGTILDTARLRYFISKYVQADPRSIHAYMLGEHGDSEFPVWSSAYIGGVNIRDWFLNNTEYDLNILDEIHKKTKNAAYEIIEMKGATYYGIGLCLARITKSIFQNESAVFPLSVYLNGEYGYKDIYIGTPASINGVGVKRILELNLSDTEKEQMRNSVNILREVINSCNL